MISLITFYWLILGKSLFDAMYVCYLTALIKIESRRSLRNIDITILQDTCRNGVKFKRWIGYQ